MPARVPFVPLIFAAILLTNLARPASAESPKGYYRQPALHKNTLVFVAEGDLWTVSADGGVARRLTSHTGSESQPAISPDGQVVAFAAEYEGPTELYTMPIDGGLPTRRTYDGSAGGEIGWTPDGRILMGTRIYSTLPDQQLVVFEISRDAPPVRTRVPLSQAADGNYDEAGRTLYFTRLPFQGSHTKRYRGGTAQRIWRFADGDAEATPLTADYSGTSKQPMWWRGRVYFLSDRDGTMNLWSMLPDGTGLRQHTRHSGWDANDPSLSEGRIAYKVGADLHLYDIAADADRQLSIFLESDLDQTREHWIKKPIDFLTAAHVSPKGDHVALTARGQVFVAPQGPGRLVEVTRRQGVRYREARFMPDGKSLLALSDESGEVELWSLPANGVGEQKQLTTDGTVLRYEAIPSPDGKHIAHHDKDLRLFILDVDTGENRRIDESPIDRFNELAWSPDSRWLAYVTFADNMFRIIRLYHLDDGSVTTVTTDRFDSYSPAWSPDGKWLFILSDRHLETVVDSPWGNYQPEPFLDKRTEIYVLALQTGQRSPFAPPDELHPADDEKEDEPATSQPVTTSTGATTAAAPATAPASPEDDGKQADDEAPPKVEIELEGIRARLLRVPVGPGNYSDLMAVEKSLFWVSRPTGGSRSLLGGALGAPEIDVKTVVDDVRAVELSGDRKKILVRKGESLYVVEAAPAPASLDKKNVDLSAWSLSVIPREEWRQMFVEAWRLERDYFYQPDMHGVDWQAVLQKYLPLVDRVTTRAELSDLIGQMVAELSALHTYVVGGDTREAETQSRPSSLGALLRRDAEAGGYVVEHVYASDPDEPERTAPLARPEVDVRAGDVIEMVNGVPALSVPDIDMLLRNKAGQQVLLRVKPQQEAGSRDVIVRPISMGSLADLRYDEWEYTRRRMVEELGGGQIGYVHLRAMGGGNYTEWARGYYPAFNRAGLIVDVRHNGGGNIDSWILGRLVRKVWFYWNQHAGQAPNWNMQQAFRGHIAAICDERTASDGEAFVEGIKRLEIGKVIGTRTWGGEIWLSFENRLVDGGIASAAEYGVFGPEGDWLIEGHGVEPDIVVDNLPHATFNGEDAQLRAAIEHLLERIREAPVEPVRAPPPPDKSFRYPR